MRHVSKILVVASACFLLGNNAAPRGGEGKTTVPAGAKDVLNDSSYWRWHRTMRPPIVDEGNGKLSKLPRARVNYRNYGDHLTSPLPPKDWASPDFDDSSWPRGTGKDMRGLVGSRYSSAIISVRGKFRVGDPNGVSGLYVSLSCIGGAVVYVNGKEVARRHVPEGELKPETPGEIYPKDAYVDAKGKMILGGRARKKLPAAAKKDVDARVAKRVRKLTAEIPGKLLRRGVNVLAIQIRRSHHRPEAKTFMTSAGVKKGYAWRTLYVGGLKLQAVNGAAANTARPQGVQVWVHDINNRVNPMEWGDPTEKTIPLRLFGARNGSFYGEIAVGSTAQISGLSMTPGGLKSAKGSIPAKSIDVLYGKLDMRGRYAPWFLGLQKTAPGGVKVNPAHKAAVQAVALRVNVPKDAAPGLYKGVVKVSASGKSFDLPVEMNVADWALPNPRNFRTYVGIYQSPTTVSLVYKVPLWSEDHWKKVEKSFEMLARVGNKMVNIPVVDETQFGNPEGMIWFIKKKDGTWDYDFKHFDRYMKIVTERCGPQDYVCLQIWHAGGWSHRKADTKCTVQVIDEATGKRTPMQVPLWGSPKAAEFWKPLFAKIQERLSKLKMPKAMTVGILSDSTAPPEVFKTIKQAWPGGSARWHRGCHVANGTKSGKPYGIAGGNLVTLHEHCYGMEMAKPDVKQLPQIHVFRGRPGTAYFRVSNHMTSSTQLSARTMVERGLWCGKQGIGRICFDFWDHGKKRRGSNFNDIYNRYPHSSCAQRRPSLAYMSWPGKDGAETNKRFELFLMGLQEVEAMMVVSRGAASASSVGAELASKCKKLLRARLNYCHARNDTRWNFVYYNLDHLGWQDLAKRTYDLAGEVAKKLK